MSRMFHLALLSTAHLSGAAAGRGQALFWALGGRSRVRGMVSAPERFTVKVGRRARIMERNNTFVIQNSLGWK